MKPGAEARVKRRLDQLIFNSLLREPIAGTQQMSRIAPNVDKDYVSVIARIRRYLYGDLSEKALRRFQQRGAPLRRFKGVMSAYPLLDDLEALAAVDDWLLDRLWLAVRKRERLLAPHFPTSLPLPAPYNLGRDALRRLKVASATTGDRIDLTVPSLLRIAGVILDAAAEHGAATVGRPVLYLY